MVAAVFQGDRHHVVEGVLELEFRDADGVVVRLRDEAHLAGAVIDKDDAGGFVQVHDPVFGGDMIQEIFILADVADETIREQIADIQLLYGAGLQQGVIL